MWEPYRYNTVVNTWTILNRIVLNRIKFRVDLLLRDMQAEFRKRRTCTAIQINPGAICRVEY